MKISKKIISFLTAGVILTSSASLVSAENVYDQTGTMEESDTEPQLYLIEETETVMDDGIIVIDRYYSDSPNFGIDLYSTTATSGTKTLKHSKLIQNSLGLKGEEDLATIWVQATFSWNSDELTATVDKDSIDYGYTLHGKNVRVSDQSVDYGSNQGSEVIFGWGHKYAYVRYNVSITGSHFSTKDYNVYIDLNTQGEPKKS